MLRGGPIRRGWQPPCPGCQSRQLAPVKDTVRSFKEILDGKYDHLPEQAFYMVGPIEEVIAKAEKMGVKV